MRWCAPPSGSSSLAGGDPVDGDVDGLDRVGARDRPVASGGEPRSAAREIAERVLAVHGALLEERQSQSVELRSSWQAQSAWRLAVASSVAKRAASSSLDDLQVREVVAAVGRAVRLACRFDRIQRLLHGAVAERVEMHLEALAVECGHTTAEKAGVDEGEAGVVGVVTVRLPVRRLHRGRVVLGDPVDHDLHVPSWNRSSCRERRPRRGARSSSRPARRPRRATTTGHRRHARRACPRRRRGGRRRRFS